MSEGSERGLDASDAAEFAAALHAAAGRGAGYPEAKRTKESDTHHSEAVTTARKYLKARRRREAIFPTGLFSDPAWDMLLALYIAEADRRPVSISSACIAAAVPGSTALRWIGKLEACSLVVRRPDHADHRFTWLELSDGVAEKIEHWLLQTFVSDH
ncbi:MarR family transcriptional regulator [Sphingomonas koreensis]|nr:MarR family transcriptional regulator [Sphingomonas koreensis]